MDNTEIDNPEVPKNNVLLYATAAFAVVGVAVVITKTARFTTDVARAVKQKRAASKTIEIVEPAASI